MKSVPTPGRAADATRAKASPGGVPFEVAVADNGYDGRGVVDDIEAPGP